MKRIAFVLVYFVLVAGFAGLQAKNGYAIQREQLPAKAQTTLNKNFGGLDVKKVYQKDVSEGVPVYEVKLEGNTTIEFDMVGAWNYIKAKKNDIPVSVLPNKLMKALETDEYLSKRIKYVDNDGLNYNIQFKDGSFIKANAIGDILVDSEKK